MNVPQGLFYTKDHEWARVEGKKAYVGITDHAQHALGDITFVDPPKKGQQLKQGEYCATVESVKAASDVFAPFSGTVVEANAQLSANPALVNRSPYDEGYFFVMELSVELEKSKLMDAAAYTKYLEGLDK
jgi:glycine cleavage system H protein